MKRDWKEIPRDGKRAQWAGLYVTINGKGTIVMNRAAYERLDEPAAFLLFYDAPNNSIGLKPTAAAAKNAYPVLKSGRHGGKKVSAYRWWNAVCISKIRWNSRTPRSILTEY